MRLPSVFASLGGDLLQGHRLTSYDISARYPAPGTLGAVNHKLYQQLPADTSPTMRIVEQTRTLWFADDATVPATYLSAPLPLGVPRGTAARESPCGRRGGRFPFCSPWSGPQGGARRRRPRGCSR